MKDLNIDFDKMLEVLNEFPEVKNKMKLIIDLADVTLDLSGVGPRNVRKLSLMVAVIIRFTGLNEETMIRILEEWTALLPNGEKDMEKILKRAEDLLKEEEDEEEGE